MVSEKTVAEALVNAMLLTFSKSGKNKQNNAGDSGDCRHIKRTCWKYFNYHFAYEEALRKMDVALPNVRANFEKLFQVRIWHSINKS